MTWKNTEHTYEDLIEQNQINPNNQIEDIMRMRANNGDVQQQL